MKEMCLPCYGTGQIGCQTCGGTGIMPNISLLGEDCLKCEGSRKGAVNSALEAASSAAISCDHSIRLKR